MDGPSDVSLIRNVQPTDRKLSVSKESIGPRKNHERKEKGGHGGGGSATPEKGTGGYGKNPSANAGDDSHEIDITI